MSAALGSFQAAQTLGLVAGPLLGGLLADVVGARAAFFVSGLCFLPAIVMVQRFYHDIPAGSLDAEPGAAAGTERKRASLFQVLAAAPSLVLVMGVLYCVNFADAGLGPLMPLLLAEAGAPPGNLAGIAGATVSAASLGAAASAYAFGRLGTRMDTSRALLPVLVVGAAMAALLGLADSWWVLAAGRILLGLVVGGTPALIYTIAAQTASSSQRGAAMGFVSSFGLLGYASGPLATGAAARLSSPAVFATVGAAYLVGALLLAARTVGRNRASAKATEAA
jgi:DHA1 family multidrug resistance protein-like MFS transporter